MRRSDFCVGVVPSSLPPSGLPLMADPRRPPWVMTLNVPPLPPPIPLRPRMDFGRRVRRHADPAGPACSRVHLRSVLRYASGFFPTRPHGASAGVSRRQGLRAVASGSRLLPPRPAKDFHLQSSAHARHTNADFIRVGGKAVEGILASGGPVLVADQLPDTHYAKKLSLAFRAAHLKANGVAS